MAIAREVIEAPDLLPLPFPGISPSITVGTIVGLMASGSRRERILQSHQQLAPGRAERGPGPELMASLLVDMPGR